jgi:hypothetical protein
MLQVHIRVEQPLRLVCLLFIKPEALLIKTEFTFQQHVEVGMWFCQNNCFVCREATTRTGRKMLKTTS